MQEIKKIVVIGPESTGKSTICTMLSRHYNALWCPEYAREYLLQHGTNYTFNTLEIIARGQLQLEEEYISKTSKTWQNNQNQNLLFIDTNMYVMKVWCEYVFSQCHTFILEEIVKRNYDLYLLCNTDIAWVKDELREYPDEQTRLELYHIYKDILVNQKVPWVELKGNYTQRFQTAVDAVTTYCP